MINKTGLSMSTIIDTKKARKYRKMEKCDCKRCVNNSKKGCRFGWKPINGKCNRYGTNHYELTEEEKMKAEKLTELNKVKSEEEKLEKEKIHNTTLEKINQILETSLNINVLRKIKNYKFFGNGKFQIKYIGDETIDLISIKFKDKKVRKYKIIK